MDAAACESSAQPGSIAAIRLAARIHRRSGCHLLQGKMITDPMTSVPSRRWWLPSLSQVIWIAVFLGLFLSHQRLDMINTDGDACCHLRSGQWMLEHREVMRTEPFLHTRAGSPV